MASEEMLFRGRPASFEERACVRWGEFAVDISLTGGEEMEVFARASAGDVEEAFFLGALAAIAEGAQPVVEFVRVFALAPDGSQNDGGFLV